MSNYLYELNSVGKIVSGASEEIQILKDINFKVKQGDLIAILGASGTGKSTLLHLMAGLDTVSSGEILMLGKNLGAYSVEERANLRNKDIGFVFQFHHLLPEFNAVENVAMPAIIAGQSYKHAVDKARNIINLVGLSHREKNSVSTLSGGERQRVAIARAILQEPKVLLADEPTGNLDIDTGAYIVDTLVEISRDKKMALIMVTHNNELASRMGRICELRTGELYEEEDN